jgi:hypothetical protein
MENNQLLDFGNYPEIHADGLGDVLFHQDKAHFILFGWKRIDGVWRRIVVGTITRPISSVTLEQTVALKEMFEARHAAMH